jgi:Ras-related protein Rab-1A
LQWDTAGQERYRTIASAYYRGADGIILVYDVTNRESFEHVQDWIADVRQYARADIPIVLVGSKSDLETERVVQTTEGEQAAAEMKMKAEFVEASAKLSTNVDQVILMLARQVMVQRQPSKKNPSSGSKTLDLDGSSGKSSAFSKCCS